MDNQLLTIAQRHLHSNIKSFESRKSDSADFFEVSIWGIEAALKAAYEAGAASSVSDRVACSNVLTSPATPAAPKAVAVFAEELSDAYSTSSYLGGWANCIKRLRARGYNDIQIEAIIRSKHTRWAADESQNSYGNVTATDLLRYIAKQKNFDKQLSALVAGTF